MNDISKKGKPWCYTKSTTVQNVFQPIPGLINCAVVNNILYLLSKTTNEQYEQCSHVCIR